MDISNIWNLFLEKVKDMLDPILYETWFMDTKLIDLNDSSAKVLVPMQVHKKHLKENYNDLVEEIFTEITGTIFNFEYVIGGACITLVEYVTIGGFIFVGLCMYISLAGRRSTGVKG